MAEAQSRKIIQVTDALPKSEEFTALVVNRSYLDGAIKDLEAQKDELDGKLLWFAQAWQTELGEREPCLFELPVEGDSGEVARVGVYQNRGRKEIKPELLLAQGVTVEQIEAATVGGAMGKAYARVTKAKGK